MNWATEQEAKEIGYAEQIKNISEFLNK